MYPPTRKQGDDIRRRSLRTHYRCEFDATTASATILEESNEPGLGSELDDHQQTDNELPRSAPSRQQPEQKA